MKEPLSLISCTYAGLAGSVLEGRLNRTEAPAWYCAKRTDDFRVLWLSLQEASRPVCLLDELALFYNATTGRCKAFLMSAFPAQSICSRVDRHNDGQLSPTTLDVACKVFCGARFDHKAYCRLL